jgi:RHS repeat-associated protein
MTVNPISGGGLQYDASGNSTGDGSVLYDATGQMNSYPGGPTQSFDGDGLRAKKIESGVTTYYLRSSVLGGQVVSELNSSGQWTRGYVYLGGQMVAIQANSSANWTHQDPVTKSQRVTDSSGAVISTVDLDPWGQETGRSSNQAFQPHRFTSYDRDADGGDDAMMRRYWSYWARFSQPDPYEGSYDLTDPQSFNRYAYVQNDPVSYVDPSGLLLGNIAQSTWVVNVVDHQRDARIDTFVSGGRTGGAAHPRYYRVEPREVNPQKPEIFLMLQTLFEGRMGPLYCLPVV